jgi:hypothetical protein
MPLQRSHHRDMRHHRIAAMLANHHQHFGSGLPFRRLLFGLRQFHDVVCSVAERDQLATVWQNAFDYLLSHRLKSVQYGIGETST